MSDPSTSKKSKVQSHGLAAAILEGLMPVASEDEPEDINDESPSRVRIHGLLETRSFSCLLITSLPSARSMPCRRLSLHLKSSLPFVP
jgi:hypothetical protein